MFYIRRKDNHLMIKACGYVDEPTGLGEFDPAVYEAIEAATLPEGAQLEPPPKSMNQVMEEAFLLILGKHLGKSYLTAEVMAEVFKAKVAIIDANKLGLLQVTRAIIQALVLPTEMEADRTQMLAMIPG